MAFPPQVGVSTDCKMIDAQAFFACGEKYVRAVVDGVEATPWLLPSLDPPLDPDGWLERLDGLLLTGSLSNIEPHRYGPEPSWPGNPHDPARDGNALALIPRAVARGLPVLAICRGLQEVNVAFGGSLQQKVHELPDRLDHRADPQAPLDAQYAPVHALQLQPGGLLASIAGGESVRVNSLHGQGIDRLGAGLQVEAHAPDGLIEAFRGPGPGFLLAVQWHPEWQFQQNRFYLGIFRAFAQACRDYAGQHESRSS